MRFGVKVVDSSFLENQKRIAKYKTFFNKLDGLELSIKNDTLIFPSNYFYWIQHSNQSFFNINSFLNKYDEFENYSKHLLNELGLFNIKNIVVHIVSDEDISLYSKREIKKYLKWFEEFSIINEVRVYFENTIITANQMKEIFSYDKKNIFGFCFDIGHSKAFVDNEKISDWLDLIKNLNKPVHVHYHTNKGNRDSHLPVTKKTNLWKNSFHEGLSYEEIAKKIVSIKKDDMESSFIMETHASFSKNNVCFLRELMRFKKKIKKY